MIGSSNIRKTLLARAKIARKRPEIAAMIKPMSASRLSKLTHNKVWEDTPKGQIIPIESAYSVQIMSRRVRKLTDPERNYAKNILEGLYGSVTPALSATR